MSRFHGNDCLLKKKKKLGKKYRGLHLSINSEEEAHTHTHKCTCPHEVNAQLSTLFFERRSVTKCGTQGFSLCRKKSL